MDFVNFGRFFIFDLGIFGIFGIFRVNFKLDLSVFGLVFGNFGINRDYFLSFWRNLV